MIGLAIIDNERGSVVKNQDFEIIVSQRTGKKRRSKHWYFFLCFQSILWFKISLFSPRTHPNPAIPSDS